MIMFKKLLRETFDLWCRRHWLKIIDKEINKREKCYQKYRRHDYIVKQLVVDFDKRYNKLVCEENPHSVDKQN